MFQRFSSTLLLVATVSLASSQIKAAEISADAKVLLNSYIELFVERVATDWTSYQVCELYHKGYRNRVYLQRIFPAGEMPLDKDIDRREIWVRETAASVGAHLGLYVLSYVTQEAASQAFKHLPSEQPWTQADGKVLTKYAAKLHTSRIVLVYSETFLDPTVKSYLIDFIHEPSTFDPKTDSIAR
ncbi:MAG: hypothetical protein U1E38_09700 [Rhodospirillales bacterium]